MYVSTIHWKFRYLFNRLAIDVSSKNIKSDSEILMQSNL